MKVLVVLVLALAVVPAAHAGLEEKLPTAVPVHCVNTGYIGFFGRADFEHREIYIQNRLCRVLLHDRSSYLWPLAVEVLYHEWWHVAFQEENEHFTDCGSLVILRYMLRTRWGMTVKQAQGVYLDARAAAPYGC